MTKFNGTKGKFKDGKTGWKVGERQTNGVNGYEIHWSDDGECVTDHVYNLNDAKLIANAPELLEALHVVTNELFQAIECINGLESAKTSTSIRQANEVLKTILE